MKSGSRLFHEVRVPRILGTKRSSEGGTHDINKRSETWAGSDLVLVKVLSLPKDK